MVTGGAVVGTGVVVVDGRSVEVSSGCAGVVLVNR